MSRLHAAPLVALWAAGLAAGCNIVSGVDDLSFECGTVLLPTSESCPAECNGDCTEDNGVCVVNCGAPNAAISSNPAWCTGETVTCPPGMDCIVQCRFLGAGFGCAGTTIVCPDDLRCTVQCEGEMACRDTLILCSESGACGLKCASPPPPNAAESCFSTSLVCGLNQCTAECEDHAGTPTVTCGDSCGCTPCD